MNMRAKTDALMLVCLLTACGGGGGDASAGSESAAETAEAQMPTGPDPCTLVSAAEMEALLGPLGEPPFRVDSNRRPDPGGEGCFYRARDGRNVTIFGDWESGPMGFQMMVGMGSSVTDVLSGYDAVTDTLDEGGWDKIGSAFGQLMVLKDTVSVHIDPLGSRIGLPGAVQLASIAVGRVHAPLAYDGARATRNRKERPAETRSPCDLITRQEAEALMGTLSEDPKVNEDGTGCEFVTDKKMMDYPVSFTLEVQWRDGFYALGQEREAIGGAAKAMAVHVDPDIPDLSEQAAGEAEPWDERITLLGGVIEVVKDDVLLKIAASGAFGFDEEKGLQVLRIAAGRI